MKPSHAPAQSGTRRVIRRPELIAKTGLSRTTIYMLERAGQFPTGWPLTPRCRVWDEAEIDAWILARRASALEAATSKSLPWPPAAGVGHAR